MGRRRLLTVAERELLLGFPKDETELIRYYTFSEKDLSLIYQHRGERNRLGFAVQLCYLRYPGYSLPIEGSPPPELLRIAAAQIKVDPAVWPEYAGRAETRREHLTELQTVFSFKPFSTDHYKAYVQRIADVALQTDKAIVLATTLVQDLRKERVIVPGVNVIERACKEAVTRANRQIYKNLAGALTKEQCDHLNNLLLLRPPTKNSQMIWLRQPPGASSARNILEHIERLKIINSLGLPDSLEKQIHQNRLLKLAREGGQ